MVTTRNGSFGVVRKKTYLLIVDYYSRWIELKLFHQLTSAAVIHQIKSVLAAHGIPDVIASDNGPQFASSEFARFANDYEYGFTHVTSSPKYPQANGEAERAVRTVKQLLKKNKDPYIALLMYRATPLQNGSSPAELLMSRKLQTKVPVFPTTLKPSTPDFDSGAKKEAAHKERQRNNYDRRHATRELPIIKTGDSVWIRDTQRSGEVISTTRSPRSYLIRSPQGIIRRNRTAIINTSPGEADTPVTVTPRQSQGTTRLADTPVTLTSRQSLGAIRLADTPVTVPPRQSQGTTRLAAQMPGPYCFHFSSGATIPNPAGRHVADRGTIPRYEG